jgi:uncharacterized protein YyaL (SSP411 family)
MIRLILAKTNKIPGPEIILAIQCILHDYSALVNSEMPMPNALKDSLSPYLKQHADNPVNWYPWSEEVLAKARAENKLMIISIGYSACHWCHVMEHESFSDPDVAAFMNAHFICIKVDREERPDVDQIYMEAVQLLTGSGGWPLNAIALPDGRPVYGGTYFPRERWLEMLSAVRKFVLEKPEKAEDQATALTNGIRQTEWETAESAATDSFTQNDLDNLVNPWLDMLDNRKGGYKRAPKFPMPIGHSYLLEHHHYTGNAATLAAVDTTLTAMARGGIYDQIGGGFARYSTDEDWLVPHFEKMLYDNAQLISLYANAFQHSKTPLYETVIRETIAFVERELTAPSGGFYAALDADSEGEEGKYYVWSYAELKTLAGTDADALLAYYNITPEGNWESDKNIPHITRRSADKGPPDNLVALKEKLLAHRQKRVPPGLDNKILCAWNGLMISALVAAGNALGEAPFIHQAARQMTFLLDALSDKEYRLCRQVGSDKAGFLDDYAFTIAACIDLYQATFDENWLKIADGLTTYAIGHFKDAASGLFFFTSNQDAPLIARKMEVTDNVIPAANSQMANNLFNLGHFFGRDDYIDSATTMLHRVRNRMPKSGPYYANWAKLMAKMVHQPYEIAIVGPDWSEQMSAFNREYLPDVLYCGGPEEGTLPLLKGKRKAGETWIYVCRNRTCRQPVQTAAEALAQMKQ